MQGEVEKAIKRSAWYRRYARAFVIESGLPLRLVSARGLARQAGRWETLTPFCRKMQAVAGTVSSCRHGLLALIRDLTPAGSREPQRVACPMGLSVYAVPVAIWPEDALLLVTGGVLAGHGGANAAVGFEKRLAGLLAHLGPEARRGLSGLVNSVQVVPADALHAHVRMLTLLGAQLAEVTEEMWQATQAQERDSIRKARALIAERHREPIHLPEIARACGMSAGHFSRVFHRETGLTFASYVSHVRVAAWQHLLADHARAVSDTAFEAGFQSLSQANRAFRAIVGFSPSAYRAQLRSRARWPVCL
ncbi:MAG: AraC family transcriptional regulator [Candidatus Marinimicrobia bacterium]|nr:AraC family transcriptional regulator [Candidatus Neomarinimicrobiota bacterium]